jgi:hypothetical protein
MATTRTSRAAAATVAAPAPSRARKTAKAAAAPVELDPSVYADLDRELDALADSEVQDWDAFWTAQQAQAKPARIRGVVVRPPMDMPLSLLKVVEQVQGSSDERSHKDLLARIFGRDVFDTWESNGMGLREMQIVLCWGGAHMRGQVVTFEEAMDLFTEAERAQGKAPKAKAPKAKRPASSRRR